MALALLLAVAAMPGPAVAQGGGLQVTAVGAEAGVLVLDVANVLTARVRNAGSAPATPSGEFRVTDGDGVTRVLPVDGGSPLLPGNERAYTAQWNGRTAAGAAMRLGPVTVTFDAQDVAGPGASRSATLPFESHKLGLAVGDRSSDTMPPGTPWGHLTATVTNEGSVALAANLVLSQPANAPPGWVYSFRPDQTVTTLTFAGPDALPPGGTQQAFVYITAPYTAEPGTPSDQGAGVLTARAGPADPATVVALRALSPHVAAGGQLGFAVTEAPAQPTAPGGQASFTVRVRNDQNRDEVGTLRLTPPPGAGLQAAAVDPAGPQGMSAGEGLDYAVAISVPALGDPGALAGPHAWTASYESEVGDRATTTFSTPVTVVVAPVRRVEATVVSTSPDPVLPGGTLQATVRVCNRGNVPAAYALSHSVFVAGTGHAWQGSSPAMSAPLAPQACQETGTPTFPPWTAKVPDGFAAGGANLRIVAQDLQDAAIRSEPAFAPVQVAAAALPRLTVEADTHPILAGQTRTFQVRLENRGNTAGPFALALQTVAAEPAAGWDVVAPVSTDRSYAPGEQALLSYTVTAPSGTQAPGDRLVLRVGATGTGGAASSLDLQVAAPFADLLVCPAGGAPMLQGCPAVPIGSSPATLFRGHPGVVELAVVNLGGKATGAPVQLDVEFLSESGVPIATREVTVGPLDYQGTARTRLVQVAAPTATHQGLLRVRATVDVLQEVPEGREDNNLLQGSLQVEVFGVRIVKPADLTVQPGEALSFAGPMGFLAENLGTRGHDVVATFMLEPAWATLPSVPLVGAGAQAGNGLPKGTSAPLAAAFEVPLAPGTHVANLTLRVAHKDFPAIAVQERVRLSVADGDAPVLGALLADRSSAAVGTAVPVRARATDATGIAEARVYVVEPDGTVRWLPMAPDPTQADLFRGSVELRQPGTHQLHFWAKDRSSTPNVADGARAPLMVTALQSSGPSLLLVAPATDGALLRPGVPVVFAVHGPSSVQSVEALVNGRATTLPAVNPVQVPTDGQPDGPLRIEVTARDALGQAARMAVNLTVDGTAPDVRRIALDLAKPRPGAAVTFTAEVSDASPLRAVLLRLQAADGSVAEHRMAPVQRGSVTVHEATLAYQAGTLLAQVVAEDAAGNRGFAERSVEGLQAAPQESPMPVALLQGLLLVALALVRRRA